VFAVLLITTMFTPAVYKTCVLVSPQCYSDTKMGVCAGVCTPFRGVLLLHARTRRQEIKQNTPTHHEHPCTETKYYK
jgi:hypothetical protein